MTPWTFVLLLLLLPKLECRLLCGMELITTNFMEMYVKLDCGDHLEEHQKCCNDHGSCYVQRKPYEKCDSIYCDCVKKIAKDKPICQMHSNNFCQLIATFGRNFYEAYE
ncbi:hypothetical protein V3C99_015849 [Haemonchus contortus]